MELLLLRHGEALRVGQQGIDSDEHRTLTQTGIDKTRRTAVTLNRLHVRLDALLCSPLERTLQTARLLCEGMEHRPQLRPCDALVPDPSPNAVDRIIDLLRRNAELPAIGICGHEPNLSGLLERFIGGNRRPCVVFHTGSVAWAQLDLSCDPPEATLHWFMDSRQLDLIARAP